MTHKSILAGFITTSFVLASVFQAVSATAYADQAPLTGPLTSPVTITPTPTPDNTPLSSPIIATPTPTQAPTNNSNNNSGGSSNNLGGSSNNNSNSNSNNVCRDTRPATAPLLLSAIATGPNQITLFWRKGWGPLNGYVVAYSTRKGIAQFTSPVISGESTSFYTIKGLSAGTTYYFKVQAKNGCTGGNFSKEIAGRPYGGKVNVLSVKTKNTATHVVVKKVQKTVKNK